MFHVHFLIGSLFQSFISNCKHNAFDLFLYLKKKKIMPFIYSFVYSVIHSITYSFLYTRSLGTFFLHVCVDILLTFIYLLHMLYSIFHFYTAVDSSGMFSVHHIFTRYHLLACVICDRLENDAYVTASHVIMCKMPAIFIKKKN